MSVTELVERSSCPTGELRDWFPNVLNTISGYVYKDVRGRFGDGMLITTSSILGKKNSEFKKGDIIQTLNSTYKLGRPLGKRHKK